MSEAKLDKTSETNTAQGRGRSPAHAWPILRGSVGPQNSHKQASCPWHGNPTSLIIGPKQFRQVELRCFSKWNVSRIKKGVFDAMSSNSILIPEKAQTEVTAVNRGLRQPAETEKARREGGKWS